MRQAIVCLLVSVAVAVRAQAPVLGVNSFFDTLRVLDLSGGGERRAAQPAPRCEAQGNPVEILAPQAERCSQPDALDPACTPLDFRGRNGLSGTKGFPGGPGFPDGGAGGRGGPGQNAAAIEVSVTGMADWIEVKVNASDSKRTQVLRLSLPLPEGKKIQILAQGGNGGNGGHGGRGYTGCSSWRYPDGRCHWEHGRDGRGGDGGNGGNGPSVKVRILPEHAPLLDFFSIHSAGGLPGSGGFGGWGAPNGSFGREGQQGSVEVVNVSR